MSNADLEGLLTRPHLLLGERTLWRMLHETAARAEEVLSLDLDELDLRNRRAKVRRKGGAATIVVWRTQTARLPPRRRGRGGHLGAAGDFWAHLIPL